MKRRPMNRRTVLRASGALVTLPFLDAMVGPSAKAAKDAKPPRRMVLLHRGLGTYHPYLVPKQTGLKYEAPRYLKILEAHRGRFTLFSGMSHLGYPNSHVTSAATFTGVGPEGVARGDDIHNTVSVDQVAAEKVGDQTRARSLTLNSMGGAQSLSWNRQGVPVPKSGNRSAVFKQMFIDGTPDEIKRQLNRLAHGHSILDDMRGDLKQMHASLGAADSHRIQLMESSIREAEVLLHQEEAWAKKPKPKVDVKPADVGEKTTNWIQSQQRWYALIRLILQTDSTRVITYGLGEQNNRNVPDLEIGHHGASHHGKDPAKIEQYARYESKEYQNFAGFLDLLHDTAEGDGTLLDHTMVLMTSNLGDASAHASNNLPTFLAGGGFKHQGHVGFDTKKNHPQSNLYLRMLHQFGIHDKTFGSSTGALSELG